ncbi:MAG: hypothetical protein J6V40_06160, partial [Clostridia bacterium]|nr:hypothetical protein [Clostridia bacterium]
NDELIRLDSDIYQTISIIHNKLQNIQFNQIVGVNNFDNTKYEDLYLECIEFLLEIAQNVLTNRQLEILKLRLGIDSSPKTLEDIGKLFNLTRERIRQILNKILSSISYHFKTKLTYAKLELLQKIANTSITEFLCFISYNHMSAKWFFEIVLSYKEVDFIFKNIENTNPIIQQQIKNLNKVNKFNQKVMAIVKFGTKQRDVSQEAFNRLQPCRTVVSNIDNVKNFTFNSTQYPCDTLKEKEVLVQLLKNNTFKQIKTQSIKIPINNTYFVPDFQCLTHNNQLVIIDIKDKLQMFEKYNLQKIEHLKDYCMYYGFGYAIIDHRFNSFYDIYDYDENLELEIMSILNKHSSIDHPTFNKIQKHPNFKIDQLLTIIKKNNLKLTLNPFTLSK